MEIWTLVEEGEGNKSFSAKKLSRLARQLTNKNLSIIDDSYISSPNQVPSTLNHSNGYSTKKSSGGVQFQGFSHGRI